MSHMSYLRHPLTCRIRRLVTVLLILWVLGLCVRPLEVPAWEAVKAKQRHIRLKELQTVLGQGLVVGVLGGFRTIVADFLWIRTYTVWERRDRVKLDAMIRLVTMLDPRSEFFWIQGSRMLAYDVPHWRIRQEGGYDVVSESGQQAINLEQAEQALELLDRALESKPNCARFYLEKGQIYLNRLKDERLAAKWFLKASEQAGAPYFAARIYARLLQRMGQERESYEFLRKLYRRLPDVVHAQKPIILERIRDLEYRLKITSQERFQPIETLPHSLDP